MERSLLVSAAVMGFKGIAASIGSTGEGETGYKQGITNRLQGIRCDVRTTVDFTVSINDNIKG